jgi:hypothetical protein
LHKTIDTILKAREIQKARVDSNVMREELTQEELERSHRPMVDQLASIVDTTKSQQTTLIPIEGLLITGPPQIEYSTGSVPKETSKSLKESSKESSNVFYPDKDINEDIVKKVLMVLICLVKY